jgi:hypothetical protein
LDENWLPDAPLAVAETNCVVPGLAGDTAAFAGDTLKTASVMASPSTARARNVLTAWVMPETFDAQPGAPTRADPRRQHSTGTSGRKGGTGRSGVE